MRPFLPFGLAALALSAACSGGGPPASPAVARAALATPTNPMDVDIGKLRIDGPGDRVLVQARGKPFIRAGEYNAWLGSYPLNITASDAPAARAQALDQMVNFRLLFERAVAAGYEAKSGPSSDAAAIVLRYVTDHIRSSATVSDAAAQRYHDDHREEFSGIDGPEVAPELRLAAWKGAVRGAQLAAALEENRTDAKVEILLASSGSPERKDR
jgi:hypothetical protein